MEVTNVLYNFKITKQLVIANPAYMCCYMCCFTVTLAYVLHLLHIILLSEIYSALISDHLSFCAAFQFQLCMGIFHLRALRNSVQKEMLHINNLLMHRTTGSSCYSVLSSVVSLLSSVFPCHLLHIGSINLSGHVTNPLYCLLGLVNVIQSF